MSIIKYFVKIHILLFGVVFFIAIAKHLLGGSITEQSYIAHGGGNVGSSVMSESLEALNHSAKRGFKYLELDLLLTKDSLVVAFHDWIAWHLRVRKDGKGNAVFAKEFKSFPIDSLYTPMSGDKIDSFFIANPDIYFVTDKISSKNILDDFLSTSVRKRTYVECFSYEDYETIKMSGEYSPMISSFMPFNEAISNR
ncbi:glycerophosphodiester phosphodiesterase family protein [Fibrobacter sp. UWH1]|uniref:glycerophosphodiester phosphodiesterase family protein n=1 Tax=Fibrobacter sp. UWH1 TaxID=1964354 RepID=UPI000B51EC64|nr:glycerophosphodiester phosphodiesterase family protein [Fibrobacter sp. UWH1]OWV04410.1 hypothetical protein B7992_15905 [Fibrobacter sp. UWH1]